MFAKDNHIYNIFMSGLRLCFVVCRSCRGHSKIHVCTRSANANMYVHRTLHVLNACICILIDMDTYDTSTNRAVSST